MLYKRKKKIGFVGVSAFVRRSLQKPTKFLRLICGAMSACISALPLRRILILMDELLQGLETLSEPLDPDSCWIHLA